MGWKDAQIIEAAPMQGAVQPAQGWQVAPVLEKTKESDDGLFSGNLFSQLKNAASAAAHHVMNLPHGAAQLIQNGINYGAQQLPDNPVSRYINDVVTQDNAAMKQREDEYQKTTPNTLGAYTGATLGAVAPFLLNAVAKPVVNIGNYIGGLATKELPPALAKTGSQVASGIGQGTAIGALQPVAKTGDYWDQKSEQLKSGAIFGGAAPVASKGIGAVYSGAKQLIQPIVNPMASAAQKLSAQTGIDPKALAAMLSKPTEYVSGSMPTTAQVIATPEAVQLEKALRNNPSFTTKFENLANENNAARLTAVNNVAGSPGQLELAKQLRKETAQANYQQAFSEFDPAAITPWLKGQVTILMKRPAMQEAIAQARKDAMNEGIKLNDETSIQGLHYAKMALDKKISTAFNNGDNVQGLMDTKQTLLNVMNKLSPSYKNAMETYAKMSEPVNTMEVGRQMQELLWNRPMNTGGNPNILFQNYKSSLAKSLGGAEYGIEPQARQILQNVQDDLRRATISNGLKFPGSDTQYNNAAQGWLSRKMYGDSFSGNGIFPKLAGGAIGAATGSVVGSPLIGASAGAAAGLGLSKYGAAKVNNALAEIMTSPSAASKALGNLSQKDRDLLSKLLLANPMTNQLFQAAKNSP